MPKPDLGKVPPFYHNYVNQVDQEELSNAFSVHLTGFVPFIESISEEKWDYRYAEGKWSIKELIQHIIDAERIFSYRALCFARKDGTPLPGFDENTYVAFSNADKRNKQDLLAELKAVQVATARLFESFDEEQLDREGIVNNKSISVRAIGFIIIGHTQHHKNILQEHYL